MEIKELAALIKALTANEVGQLNVALAGSHIVTADDGGGLPPDPTHPKPPPTGGH